MTFARFAYLKPKHRNSRNKAQKAQKGRARIAAKERKEIAQLWWGEDLPFAPFVPLADVAKRGDGAESAFRGYSSSP